MGGHATLMQVPGDKREFDMRRNSSMVQPIEAGALKRCLDAMEAFRRNNPRHAEWIAAGAPSIRSEEDHIRWFGEPYAARRRRS